MNLSVGESIFPRLVISFQEIKFWVDHGFLDNGWVQEVELRTHRLYGIYRFAWTSTIHEVQFLNPFPLFVSRGTRVMFHFSIFRGDP